MKNYQDREGEVLSVVTTKHEIIFEVKTKKGIYFCHASAFSDLESTYSFFTSAKVRIYKDKSLKDLVITLRSI